MRALDDGRLMASGIIAATVIGWLLRLNGIGERTLFWDEAYHVRLALEPTLGQMLDAVLRNPPSDPLYATLLRGWVDLLGTSDPLLRLPSTIFGALTAPAAAWLAWETTASRRVAATAAMLVAVAPYLVEFGQEASMYALATLLATLALAAGLRWLRTARKRDAVLAVVLAAVASYGHYVVPVVLAAVALLSLTRLGPPRAVPSRHVALAMALVGLAWAPWAVPMIATWLGDADARTALANTAALTELGGALSQYASGTGALLERVRPIQILGIAAAGVLLARSWHVSGSGRSRALRLLLLVAAVLFLGLWLASQASGRWLFVPHLMLFVLPAAAVAAAAGAQLPVPATRSRLAAIASSSGLATVAMVGLLFAQLAGVAVNAVSPPHGNDGTREVVAAIGAQGAPSEPVFVTPAELQIVLEHYVAQPVFGLPRDLDLRHLYPQYHAPTWHAERIARFDRLSAGHAGAWLFYAPYFDADGRFLEWLSATHGATLVTRQPSGDLYRVELR